MNNSSKLKPKKSEKSPKTKPPSVEATAKGSASDSSHGNNSPVSKFMSTPAQSPQQQQQKSTAAKDNIQSSGDSQGGSTGGSMTVTVSQQMAGSTASSGLLSPSSVKPSPTLWFTTEIQQMMYGFGDCRKPLAESASLVEEIVNQQMTTLLYNAEEVGRMRNARFLGIEDFLFLLRKDKVKLRRLMRYLTLKDVKQNAMKTSSTVDEGDDSMDMLSSQDKQPMSKRQKICHDFLSTIDQTGELLALLDDDSTDEIKHERALRAELLTRHMDSQQYLEYCEARQASFTPRYKIQKFKDWLMAGVTLDIKPNPLAMEVLSYLAYETVAQIVDLALLVKHDQQVTPDDPLSLMTPAVCMNHDVPPVSQSGDGLLATTGTSAATTAGAGMKSPPGAYKPGSPSSSPPATPTTPGSLSSSVSLSQSQGSSSAALNKNKNKKKKKSGSSSSRDVFTSQAITPADIRETLRRYSQCIGPFADFSKCPMVNPMDRLLCC